MAMVHADRSFPRPPHGRGRAHRTPSAGRSRVNNGLQVIVLRWCCSAGPGSDPLSAADSAKGRGNSPKMPSPREKAPGLPSEETRGGGTPDPEQVWQGPATTQEEDYRTLPESRLARSMTWCERMARAPP